MDEEENEQIQYNIEQIQNIEAQYNIDVEDELYVMLSAELSKSIDREILKNY